MPAAQAPGLRVPSTLSATSVSDAVDTTDHELMLAVRAGEVVRLGELFERHHLPLYRFFVHLTNQPTASEDLVQIVFCRILKYRHTYRDEGRFTAWMYHLARRVAADHYRRQSRQPGATDPADLLAHPDEAPAPDTRAATSDDLSLLRTALAQLPHEDREVLVLSRLQNVGHQEIAQLLDCSIGAAKVRAHRALKELRRIYFRLRREPAA